MTTVLWITIPGAPITKKNSQRMIRVGGRTIPIPSKQAAAWTKSAIGWIAAAVRAARQLPLDVPVSLQAHVFRKTTPSAPGDLSNYLAAICDALERGGAVVNDQLIRSHDGSRLRQDKARPRVEITLSLMDEADL